MAPLDDGMLAADVGMIDLNVVLDESADGRTLRRQEEATGLLRGACREHEVESRRHEPSAASERL